MGSAPIDVGDYKTATVGRSWILWMASLDARPGHRWMSTSGPPIRYGFTRRQAIRRIRTEARRHAVREGITEKVRLDG